LDERNIEGTKEEWKKEVILIGFSQELGVRGSAVI
jgi:hypothetical protein